MCLHHPAVAAWVLPRLLCWTVSAMSLATAVGWGLPYVCLLVLLFYWRLWCPRVSREVWRTHHLLCYSKLTGWKPLFNMCSWIPAQILDKNSYLSCFAQISYLKKFIGGWEWWNIKIVLGLLAVRTLVLGWDSTSLMSNSLLGGNWMILVTNSDVYVSLCVWGFPTPISNFQTLAGCLIVQLNSDTIYLEIASDSSG